MTPEELLEVARWLANDRRTGKAKLVFRRRSISTSYYAIFRALAQLCADEIVRDRTVIEWETVSRSLEHAQARNTLQTLAREMTDASIMRIAGTFSDLWVDRQEADYGSGREFTSSEADGWVDFASEAVAELALLSPPVKRQLVVRLLFKSRQR